MGMMFAFHRRRQEGSSVGGPFWAVGFFLASSDTQYVAGSDAPGPGPLPVTFLR